MITHSLNKRKTQFLRVSFLQKRSCIFVHELELIKINKLPSFTVFLYFVVKLFP